MPFITTAQYPAIRSVLDVTLTESKLPNTIIASAPFHPAAEAEVTRRLGDYASAASTNESAARAVIFLTAARLAPAIPNILRKTLGDVTIQYGKTDIAEQVKELRSEASKEVAAALVDLNAPAASTMPTHFTTAPAGRVYGGGVPEGAHAGGIGA